MYSLARKVPSALKDGVAKGLYTVVDALCRYEENRRRNSPPVLGESFLSDIVRGSYRTLEYFGMEHPKKRALLNQIKSEATASKQ